MIQVSEWVRKRCFLHLKFQIDFRCFKGFFFWKKRKFFHLKNFSKKKLNLFSVCLFVSIGRKKKRWPYRTNHQWCSSLMIIVVVFGYVIIVNRHNYKSFFLFCFVLFANLIDFHFSFVIIVVELKKIFDKKKWPSQMDFSTLYFISLALLPIDIRISFSLHSTHTHTMDYFSLSNQNWLSFKPKQTKVVGGYIDNDVCLFAWLSFSKFKTEKKTFSEFDHCPFKILISKSFFKQTNKQIHINCPVLSCNFRFFWPCALKPSIEIIFAIDDQWYLWMGKNDRFWFDIYPRG